ncbi:MAG TPA: hypothetical protein VGM27_14250, partial [Acidobacteriaceae bacterium]
MRKPMHLALILIAVFLFTYSTAFGQVPPGLYCASGLHPDGYIDFSGLPPAPNITGFDGTSTPVTATLPVTGIPGLTVTITIPGLASLTSGPAYSVNGGTLQLNGFAGGGTFSTLLTLKFNQPIYGLGLDVGNPRGRFGYTYNLQVGTFDPSFNLPVFSTTASGYTLDEFSPRTASLQMVGLDTTFQTASVQFQGDPLEQFMTTTLSNLRVQSTSPPDPASSVPTKGLQQWLRADKGTNSSPY